MIEPDAESGLERAAEPQPAPRGPGAMLLAERRSQGLSRGDIARQLKLSVRQVEALERDEYGGFSGSVFVRGFLRNYAKLLRLDPDRLLETAGESIAPVRVNEPVSPAMPMSSHSREGWHPAVTWGAFGVLAVVVLVLLASNASKDQRETQVAERSPAPAAPLSQRPEPAPAAASPGVSDSTTPSTPVVEPAPPPEQRPALRTSPGLVGAKTDESPAPSRPPVPAASDSPGIGAVAEEPAPVAKPRVFVSGTGSSQIRMVFEDEAWVEVKDGSGDTIFARLNAPGTERLIRGQPPFAVVVGNAHSVKLLYRGKPIDLAPHTRVDVARVTLE